MIAGDDCRLVSTSKMMIISALEAQIGPLVATRAPMYMATRDDEHAVSIIEQGPLSRKRYETRPAAIADEVPAKEYTLTAVDTLTLNGIFDKLAVPTPAIPITTPKANIEHLWCA